MTQGHTQEGMAGVEIEVLKEQVDNCLREAYVALHKTLQANVTKLAPKTMTVPLSTIVSSLPTPRAKLPEPLSVRQALEELDNFDIDDEDMVTYTGRSAPNNSRMRECRRKSVVVDRLPAGTTAEDIREMLSGCGRIVFVALCHPRLAASYVKGAVRSHTLHAIVQFASVQEAVRAVETMNFSWRGGPHVTHAMTEFRAPSPMKSPYQNTGKEAALSTDASSTDGSLSSGDELADVPKAQDHGGKHVESMVAHSSAPKASKGKGKKSKARAEVDGNKSPSPKKLEQVPPKRDYASWAAANPGNRAHPPRFVNSRSTPSAPGAPLGEVPRLRVPRGPDGTRGFTMGRGRLLLVPAPA
eukprot:evm.model.scf_2475.2 EVM.evm.TU.scf_2475.2   scf_2475:13454-19736(-)